MCGRYTITAPADELAKRFDATLPPEMTGPRYNAAPTQGLPVLLNEGEREIKLLRWGLVPSWSKSISNDYSMINARAETITEKPTFRKALEKRRCLVLADSFFEWQKTGSEKIPMRIMLDSEEPFAFAGLWETWKKPEGGVLHSFTIITTEANDLVAPIHDRMPVILKPESEKLWLDNDAGVEEWQKLLRPYPAKLMKTYSVSKMVNAVVNDVPGVITPA
jgi:putative SOS response-associated peptidase YedK